LFEEDSALQVSTCTQCGAHQEEALFSGPIKSQTKGNCWGALEHCSLPWALPSVGTSPHASPHQGPLTDGHPNLSTGRAPCLGAVLKRA